MSALPGEGGSLSCIEGISELFDSVVLTREAEDALLIQPMFFDKLHTFLHQDWHHVRSKTLLTRYSVHETLSKYYTQREDIILSIFRKQLTHIQAIKQIAVSFHKASTVTVIYRMCKNISYGFMSKTSCCRDIKSVCYPASSSTIFYIIME